MPDRIPIKFKLLYGETWWPIGKFFVTFDPKVNTIADLKGKRLSLGLRSQSDWGVYPRLMLESLGITPANTDVRHLTPAQLTQQLIDGSTDVAVTVFGMEPNQKEWMIGGPLRQLEASGKPLKYIGMDKATVDGINKKWSTTFTHAVIPANTLPKQPQPLPLQVGLVRGYKASHPELPDDVAYNIVMAVGKMAPKLKDLHVLWKIWSPELMVAGLSDENVHPGAKKAYVELGWWDLHKKFPPMTYPN
jgi:TRAP transporter TAXI family solute receptor